MFDSKIAFVPGADFASAERTIIDDTERNVDTSAYAVFDVDLSTPHQNLPIGLIPRGVIGTSLTIEQVPNEFFFKVNSVGNDPLLALQGKTYNVGTIREVYITNEENYGTGKMVVTWERQPGVIVDDLTAMQAQRRLEASQKKTRSESVVPGTSTEEVKPLMESLAVPLIAISGMGLMRMIFR